VWALGCACRSTWPRTESTPCRTPR
jgi:hypothetical protein